MAPIASGVGLSVRMTDMCRDYLNHPFFFDLTLNCVVGEYPSRSKCINWCEVFYEQTAICIHFFLEDREKEGLLIFHHLARPNDDLVAL